MTKPTHSYKGTPVIAAKMRPANIDAIQEWLPAYIEDITHIWDSARRFQIKPHDLELPILTAYTSNYVLLQPDGRIEVMGAAVFETECKPLHEQPVQFVHPNASAGERMRHIRLQQGMTTKQMAKYLGVSATHTSHMENGLKPIGFRHIAKIARLATQEHIEEGFINKAVAEQQELRLDLRGMKAYERLEFYQDLVKKEFI